MIKKIIIFSVFFALLFGGNSSSCFAGKDQKIAVFPPLITSKYIEKFKGRRKVLLIYASWCPYCREIFPKLMKMEELRKGSVIAVSVDADNARFARYIQSYDKIPFKVILNKGAESGLQKVLAKYGVTPWDGYPTMILLDEENKVFSQGNLSIGEIMSYVMTTVHEEPTAEQKTLQVK